MKIIWNTGVDAPGWPGEILSEDEKHSVLVQVDYDFPGVASTFGWNMVTVQRPEREANPCEHAGTDGTVNCPDCGLTADVFIAAASEWLYDNDGATADDPGYFGND